MYSFVLTHLYSFSVYFSIVVFLGIKTDIHCYDQVPQHGGCVHQDRVSKLILNFTIV